jgi:hypothetical protein
MGPLNLDPRHDPRQRGAGREASISNHVHLIIPRGHAVAAAEALRSTGATLEFGSFRVVPRFSPGVRDEVEIPDWQRS